MRVVDEDVVVEHGIITSRHPGDLEAFSARIAELVTRGRPAQRHVA